MQIIGTATHSSLFDGYALDWRNAQNPSDVWLPIQARIDQQVINGILGQWDTVTSGIPDGVYQIRLRMFLSDGTFQDFVVDRLTLANSAPTQIPTIPIIQPTATLPLVVTAGASPTSIIQQPPTITPRPTFESPALAVSPDDDDGSSELFNFNAVEDAFCSGVFFSAVLFGIIIAYLLLRSQLSPFTRRLWWQIRSELEDNQKDY